MSLTWRRPGGSSMNCYHKISLQEIAPDGVLRVYIKFGNPVLAQPSNNADGALAGC